MAPALGIVFAIIALVSWGVGDFLNQRSARLVGSGKALLIIGMFSSIVLFPFIYKEFALLSLEDFALLCLLSIVVILGTAFDFEALRRGKMAVIEPIIGLELPLTVGISVLLIREQISLLQLFLTVTIFIGIMFVVTKKFSTTFSRKLFEKGSLLAICAALGTALTTVLIGVSSQQISPLMAVWFGHTALAIVSASVLFARNKHISFYKDFLKHPFTIGGQGILDSSAWIAFALATTLIPISISAAISGGYVVLAVLLGVVLSKEKLTRHQLIGVSVVLVSTIILTLIS